ncbi:hypothetical protein [Actinomadura macrotermitis]|uniref:ABM domain-containing protein n=1 Tax=Actinomadura macrotermitis TaxID=2585200 RepID=A0A7K0C0N1_9ACTN|nr:hypothetical protein [Actinomadura macrotermitis]MQY06364.1 hypothetical protein [Actinomadura macrotermitis]
MFIQVIQGKVENPAQVKATFDRWIQELAPGADGWLGSTCGVTSGGTLLALARFESAEAARRNSERPEQGEWWAGASKLFTGEVAFHDCAECDTWLDGGSDDAGFVQIMQSRVRDLDGLRAWMGRQDMTALRAARPDIIGGVMAPHGDGGLTEAIYFTTEAAAREGERVEPPPEMRAQMEELQGFYDGDVAYHDLTDPWLYSA